MRLITLLAVVGVCFAHSRNSCEEIARVGCDRFDDDEVCDRSGKVYRNMCELRKARCSDSSLRPADCVKPTKPDEGSGDKMTKLNTRCQEKLKKDCSREGGWKKVCDSNGQEYINKCAFFQAQCADHDLRMGPCKASTDDLFDEETDKKTRCDTIAKVDCDRFRPHRGVCDKNGKVYKNRCEFTKARCADNTLEPARCPRPTRPEGTPDPTRCAQIMKHDCSEARSRRRICDANGKVYHECEFAKARCADPKLKPARCPLPTRPPTDESGVKPTRGVRPNPSCERLQKADCARMPGGKVCDADGNEYSNRCEFMKAKCANKDLKFAKCKTDDVLYDEDPRCDSIAKVDCRRFRPMRVCDKSGKMYLNRCAFTKARCADNTLEPARCPRPTRPEGTPDPTRCVEIMKHDCSQDRSRRRMCDADGTVYNACEFAQARCADPDLKPARCPPPTRPPTDESGVRPTRAVHPNPPCDRLEKADCARVPGAKMCDADGNEYKNRCEFMKAKCANKELKFAKCKTDDSLYDEEDKKQKLCEKIAKADCAKQEEKTVCDKNGNKYRNKCEFRKAKCIDQTLEREDCEEGSGNPTREPKPTSEPKPTRMSKFERMCLKMKTVDCAALPEQKVCDKDGNAYRNKCAFSSAKCANKDLKRAKCKKDDGDDNDLFDEQTGDKKKTMCARIAKVDCAKLKDKEVCDKNGNKYANRCQFAQARCANPDLEKARCPVPTRPPTDEPETTAAKPTRGGKTLNIQCRRLQKTNCKVFPGKKVCDSEGTEYENWCAFKKAKCANKDITPSKCKTDDSLFDEKEKEDKNQKQCEKVAKADCAKEKEKVVCDKNGNKYRNKCEFNKAKCIDQTLERERCEEGSGEPTREPKPTHEPKPTRMSGFERMCLKMKTVDCAALPEKKVCDKDGNVYRNKCAFSSAKCANKDLKKAKCKKDDGDDNDLFDEKNGEAKKQKCTTLEKTDCSIFHRRVVCDKTGKKYRNRCAFKKAQCVDPTLETGDCEDGSGKPTHKPKPTHEPKPTGGLFSKALCRRMKTVDCAALPEKKFCDSNGNEYRNKCAFTVAKCADKTIKRVKCKKEDVDDNDDDLFDEHPRKHPRGTRPPPGSGEEPKPTRTHPVSRMCTNMQKVDCAKFGDKKVCDKDGKEYTNRCAFSKAQCADHSIKRGRCARDDDVDDDDDEDGHGRKLGHKKERVTRPPHGHGSGDEPKPTRKHPGLKLGQKKERMTRPPHGHGSGDEPKPTRENPGHKFGQKKERMTRPPHGHGSGDEPKPTRQHPHKHEKQRGNKHRQD